MRQSETLREGLNANPASEELQMLLASVPGEPKECGR